MKKLMLVVMMSMFLISFASAWDWDNVQTVYGENPNTGIPSIEIKNAFGLGETLFEGSVTEHTKQCGQDCSSKLEFNHAGGVLIDDIKFLTETEDDWIEQPVRSYRFKYEAELPEYETQCIELDEICTWSEENQTESCYTPQECSQVQTGTYTGWKTYNVGEELPEGYYEMFLEAEKKPSRTVDWVIKIQGKWLDEWAVWGEMDYFNGTEYQLIVLASSAPSSSGSVIVTQLETGKYKINTSNSDDEISRAIIAEWLFNGASGEATNFGSPTAVYTNMERDNNKRGIWATHTRGTSTTGETTYTGTFSNTATNYNVSSWSSLSFGNCCADGQWRLPSGTVLHTGSTTSDSEYGEDLTTDEYDNPSNAQIRTYYITDNRHVSVSAILLSNGNISWVKSGGLSASNIDFYEDYNFPLMKYPEGIITLDSPTDDYISDTDSVTFNATAEVTNGAYLTNMSLWTNITGTWALNESVEISGTSAFNFTDGSLVAYYPFNETTGTVRDVSMTSWNGQVGNAFNFDGKKDYVDIPDTATLDNTNTAICAWVYPTATITSTKGIITKDNGATAGGSYYLAVVATNKVRFSIRDGGTAHTATSTDTLTINDWNYVCGTYDGSNVKIYIDAGTPVSTAHSGNIDATTKNVIIGDFEEKDGTRAFIGKIDEVMIYNNDITAGDITNLYNSGNGKSYSDLTAGEKTNLVSYYSLDEVGSDPLDSHGSNDGELSGGENFGATRTGITGIVESAFDFEVSESDYVNIGNVGDTDAITISLWANRESVSGNDYLMGRWQTSGSTEDKFAIYLDSNGYAKVVFVKDDGSTDTLTDNQDLGTGSWFHIAFTYSSAEGAVLYVNNESRDTGTGGQVLQQSPSYDTFLGTFVDTILSEWDGIIDETAIWNRALTPTEISELYNEGAGLGYSASSTTTSSTQTWTKTISDTTIWNVEACDTDGDCGFATSNYTISLDAEAPTFETNLTTPIIYNFGDNVLINITVTDGNLDTCWYDYNGSFDDTADSSEVVGDYQDEDWTTGQAPTFFTTAGSTVNYTVPSWAETAEWKYKQYYGASGSSGNANNATLDLADALAVNDSIIVFNYTEYDDGGNTLHRVYANGILIYSRDPPDFCAGGCFFRWFEDAIMWNYKDDEIFSCSSGIEQEINVSSGETYTDITFYANDSVGNENSTVVSFAFDSTPPTISLESPFDGLFGYEGEIVTINSTMTAAENLDSCWYDYNGTNVTIDGCVSGVKNESNISIEHNNQNITFYTNDTLGNENSELLEWDYLLFEVNQTFDATTVETNQEDYEILLHYEADDWNSVTATLIFPTDSTSGSVANGGEDVTASASRYVPSLEEDANITFYWSVGLTNSTGTYNFNSTMQNQSVSQVDFSICDYSEGPQLFFKTFTTNNPEVPLNATFASAWTLRNADGGDVVLSRSFEDTTETNSSWGFCIEPNSTTYTVSVDITVDAANYTPTTHFIVDTDYVGPTENISLYLLNDDDSTLTQIRVTDQDNVPQQDVYVTIQRYDLGTDTYYDVAQVRTDNDGLDLVYLQWYDVWYKFVGVQEGDVVFTEGPKKVSSTPQTFKTGEIGTLNYEKFQDISYSLVFNEDTDNYVLTYVDTTGLTSSNCLKVFKRNVTNDYLICDNCQTASSATMYCNIGAWGNGTFIGQYYATGSPEYWIDVLYEFKETQEQIYYELGESNATGLAILIAGIVLSLFLITPALGVLGAILGVFVATALGFQPMDYITFGGLVVLGAAIMWAVQK